MNTITSNTTASANGQFGDLSEVTNGLNDVNQEDFFKLLTVELSSQDPLEPKKDSEFLSQVMQISSLEQARAMQSDLAAMRHEQQVIQANSMLGREVNFGETIDGKVSAVKFQDGRPMIEVDGQLYDLEQLLSINLPAENVMPTGGYRNIINPMIKQVQHDA